MQKEVILAILIGIGLGLIITYGVYRTRIAIQKTGTQQVNTDNISPTPETLNPNQLMLNSPIDGTLQTEININVSGTTLTDSFVVIFVGNTEHITQADESGNFAMDVELEQGSNVITVVAIDEDGQSSSVERIVVVSGQSLTGNSDTANEDNSKKDSD